MRHSINICIYQAGDITKLNVSHILCCYHGFYGRQPFFKFRQFFNCHVTHRSLDLSVDLVKINQLFTTPAAAAAAAAAGGQHGHRHEGGQDKGQELFHFHDVHLTLLRGSTDMRPGGGRVHDPALCCEYCITIFTVSPQICHNLHICCNILQGRARSVPHCRQFAPRSRGHGSLRRARPKQSPRRMWCLRRGYICKGPQISIVTAGPDCHNGKRSAGLA